VIGVDRFSTRSLIFTGRFSVRRLFPKVATQKDTTK